MKDTYLARLREGTQPAYLHPRMAAVLAETHGVILYQEQFLRLVHELAGFSLGHAERLRKLLSKTPDRRGARPVARGVRGRGHRQRHRRSRWPSRSGRCWRTTPASASAKAHAASYAVVAYRMAYCKAHYPAELLAAVLDNQAGFYPAQVYIEEARRLGLQLLGPDVNRSAAGTQARGRALRLGLRAVKGLRRDTVQALLVAAARGRQFVSLRDLLTRVPLSKAEITTLIEVGALDRIAGERSPAGATVAGAAVAAGHRAGARPRRTAQGKAACRCWSRCPNCPPTMPALRPYSPAELLDLEQAALGCTSAPTLTPYASQLARYSAVPASE